MATSKFILISDEDYNIIEKSYPSKPNPKNSFDMKELDGKVTFDVNDYPNVVTQDFLDTVKISFDKYKVGNIVVIKGLPYVVRGFNEGVYTLMNFNKNVIKISETEL